MNIKSQIPWLIIAIERLNFKRLICYETIFLIIPFSGYGRALLIKKYWTRDLEANILSFLYYPISFNI